MRKIVTRGARCKFRVRRKALIRLRKQGIFWIRRYMVDAMFKNVLRGKKVIRKLSEFFLLRNGRGKGR